ncbi:phosphoadenosine phosphosulfate reductase family protein [Myroides odoratimimus]|uniref:phosphoadenosine phosphosulfate reductase domain-containing protein n=1 Tax=Myroides odoratimimus TaxID=76832 RepID=UPI00257669DE|nr:phosphoadenosine phosphosulfate reductase family protein [Myroides odoratimimus]MDM1065804.1 phosphoadenosine phosphosulfate reductase family protein [Myroides odoratimimus]MDM1464033.1 phosphoadenosine phosphosulfate reductase family protein [Myroides odoratimimus]MDM1473905.1 phosphoadenosine phosphosulfate reductase family protein [Myroides odoratimimus]
MKVVITMSGGKDSQATAIWAKEKYGPENCVTVFCDVGWEAPETYIHIDYLVDKLQIKHFTLKSSKYDGMIDLAIKKKRFPSTTARFCTQELKVKPVIDWILEQNESLLFIDGIRADESANRASKLPDCRYFKYYFEPYKSNEITIAKFEQKPPITHKQKTELQKAVKRLSEGKNDEKFFTYRKKEVLKWCSTYDDSLIRPFFYSTGNHVINFSLSRGYAINPRYFKGYSRVGCDPCIMEKLPELKIAVNDPNSKTIEKVRKAEIEANSSFFPPDKVPKRYHSKVAPNGKTYPTIDDIVRYIDELGATGDMFVDEPLFKCKSVYNICE